MSTLLPKNKSELRQNLQVACEALLDKKAENLKLLYFGDKSPLTDCFIIATGTSDPHLKALRNNLEVVLKENRIETLSKDRFQPGGWLVLDAIDFVVHLFSKEQRDNYALEQLWKDADLLAPEDL
ncbi:MAG: ribosome silencing factor [Verrucomicrobiota bacterium]|nr:ribosome silencing factor [Verrucomicrobiota bacterium]MEC8244652.1 ribosome silencing factor [Verrucomicrobiota bacterium]|tara:strand:- start:144 stop:518 length:375 start_codon:yes stop_codon:yes gene_type:complete